MGLLMIVFTCVTYNDEDDNNDDYDDNFVDYDDDFDDYDLQL